MNTKPLYKTFWICKKTPIYLSWIFVFSFSTTLVALPKGTNNAIKENIHNQQQQNITGSITDTSGMPLIGITIEEKGTTNVVMSDFDGNYSITPSKPNATLFLVA